MLCIIANISKHTLFSQQIRHVLVVLEIGGLAGILAIQHAQACDTMDYLFTSTLAYVSGEIREARVRVDALIWEEHTLGDGAVGRGVREGPAEIRTTQAREVGEGQYCLRLWVHL